MQKIKDIIKKIKSAKFEKENIKVKYLLWIIFDELSHNSNITLSSKEEEEVRNKMTLLYNLEEDKILQDLLLIYKNLYENKTIFQHFLTN